jgi:hypothetical protein
MGLKSLGFFEEVWLSAPHISTSESHAWAVTYSDQMLYFLVLGFIAASLCKFTCSVSSARSFGSCRNVTIY